jgi:hypothetical protein
MSIRTQRWTTFVALIGLLVPQFALGAGPAPSPARSAVRDIELQEGGVLSGQLLNMTGQPSAKAKFALVDRFGDTRPVVTDVEGKFRVAGLRGGSYNLVVAEGAVPVRVWAKGTAPPHAQSELLMLDSALTARGQAGGGLGLLSNPWFLAAALAAAIAIPIALDDGS